MKKWLFLLIAALVGYGIYDIVREVRGAYTAAYSRTYTHAIGQMMSPAFDSLRLSGRGVRIGVLDAGFGGFDTSRWTKGLQVAAFRDFTGGDDAAFFRDEVDHGTKVCANMGGFSGDTLHGLAHGAVYYLAKTDRADEEPRSEEQNMIRGIEWLLSQGVDVICSSLAYTSFDDGDGYTPQQLDGRTSVLSHYLDSLLGARPALVFVQSAGNEGDKAWKYITFPGDVREVLTIGSTSFDGKSRFHSSGIGREEADYIKPDLAVGGSPIGTSFSTPVVAGLCACVLECRRMDRKTLIALLHAAGTQAATPNREIGYGIPQTGVLLELMEDGAWTTN